MPELWQLYDEDGNPLTGQSASKNQVFSDGLLHGAAHVWIWRKTGGGLEILLQRRAAAKRTWPNLLDISAAGHIDANETPEAAAVREVHEEIGLDIKPDQLVIISKLHAHMTAPDGSIENEYRWVYAHELSSEMEFKLQTSEVSDVFWKPFVEFKAEILENTSIERYVPQPPPYFDKLLNFFEKLG